MAHPFIEGVSIFVCLVCFVGTHKSFEVNVVFSHTLQAAGYAI
jgi:hypothetical protein